MSFGEKFFNSLKENLKGNLKDKPLKTGVGLGAAMAAGAGLMAAGGEVLKGPELLTPEGVSYARPETEEPGQQHVVQVKLDPIKNPSGNGEGSR